MVATGIVRRVDDLGRIVIPKEIRKSLSVKEGDPLEIFVNKEENCISLKPYTSSSEPWELLEKAAEMMRNDANLNHFSDLAFCLANSIKNTATK